MNFDALLSWPPIERPRSQRPTVAVVRLSGMIGGGPLRRGLSLAGLAPALERAFKLRRVKAVALAINSPGGSAVQSALIAGRIRALAEEHRLPVFAFAEDVAASGGYWLATAADEIYAQPASIIGSIGVALGSFGFPVVLRRLGVERRLYTAGEHKAALDPFQQERIDEVTHLRSVLEDVHEEFRRQVRTRRGKRLKGPEEELFSGRWWSGRKAVELGLVDDLGDLRSVLRRRYGDKVKLRLVPRPQPWWRRLAVPGAIKVKGDPTDWVDSLIAAAEERLMWSRFGQ